MLLFEQCHLEDNIVKVLMTTVLLFSSTGLGL